ncbi:putative reverse transcriptase domain-containing protein [Tanacetum coccineum]
MGFLVREYTVDDLSAQILETNRGRPKSNGFTSSLKNLFLLLGRLSFTTKFRMQTLKKALGTRLDMSTTYHHETDGLSERTNQTLEDMLKAFVIDFGGSWDTHLPIAEFSYNNSYHLSVRYAPFEALYGRKCRSPVLWAEIRESRLIGLELVQETTDKVILIKERLKAARDCQIAMLAIGVNS